MTPDCLEGRASLLRIHMATCPAFHLSPQWTVSFAYLEGSFVFEGCTGHQDKYTLRVSTCQSDQCRSVLSSPLGCQLRCRSWQPQRSPRIGPRWHLWIPARRCLQENKNSALVTYGTSACQENELMGFFKTNSCHRESHQTGSIFVGIWKDIVISSVSAFLNS